MLYARLYRPPTQTETKATIPVALVIAMTMLVLIAGAIVAHLAIHGLAHQVDFPPAEWSRNPPYLVD